MRKYDILALGELNVDLLLNDIPSLPEIGKEIFAGKMKLALGSSTAIFAANASSLGAKVAFLGAVGDDSFGRFVISSLHDKGVGTSSVLLKNDEATGLTVVMNYSDDRANVTYPGAMLHFGLKDINPDVLVEARHVHISSIFLQPQLLRDLPEILKLAKAQGCTVSLDTQWDPSEEWAVDYKQILPLIDVFMPNEKEVLCLTKTNSIEDAIDAIKEYINVAVIKMGAKGSLMVDKGGHRNFMDAFLNREVVDAIGAGDSFNSGFIASMVKGRTLKVCQHNGNLAGAISTTAAGGTGAFANFESVRNAASKFGQTYYL